MDVLKALVDARTDSSKKEAEDLVDLVDSKKDKNKEQKIDKISKPALDMLVGLAAFNLLGIHDDMNNNRSAGDDARRSHERALGRALNKSKPDFFLLEAFQKAVNVAQLAPVGDDEKQRKCPDGLTGKWKNCDKIGTPPTKRLRGSAGTGTRVKSRNTEGHTKQSNVGKRGKRVST